MMMIVYCYYFCIQKQKCKIQLKIKQKKKYCWLPKSNLVLAALRK